VSHSSTPISLPAGSVRAGFEAAARAHEAARQGRSLPAARQIAASGAPVEAAIARAAEATGVDFNYLLAQAEVESALDPSARAATSSATGLYQFIESTWLGTLKRHGHRFGLGALADEIALTPSGSAFVADPQRRAAILALREDPEIAALMAAGLAEDNHAHLAAVLGRTPSHAELYLAHFLGAGGAGRFLTELAADPGQSAAALFARPAAANRAIFYDSAGAPRSLGEVMGVIGGKLERALARASGGAAAPRIAAAGADAGRSAVSAPWQPAWQQSWQGAPYIIADEAVFGPGEPPALSLSRASPAQPGAAPLGRRLPMSEVLAATFGTDPSAAPVQVRRAYERFKVFGL